MAFQVQIQSASKSCFALRGALGGFMTKRRLAVLLSIWCACVIAAAAADQKSPFSHLAWIVSGDQEVDKEQAARIYMDACHWIEDRFAADGKMIRPHLTVHVGEA